MIVEEMQKYYDQRASEYDFSMDYTTLEKENELKPAVDLVQTHLRDRSVLELACGPGFWTQ